MRKSIISGMLATTLLIAGINASPTSAITPSGPDSKTQDQSSLSDLDPNPEEDPLYIEPEKNPIKKISSSDMFLDWTKDMEPGTGKDVVQGWAKGSAIPDTANPLEWTKSEIQGSAKMSSGLFSGDLTQSSQGSSQATSSLLLTFFSLFLIGQTIELITRGLRMAGIHF